MGEKYVSLYTKYTYTLMCVYMHACMCAYTQPRKAVIMLALNGMLATNSLSSFGSTPLLLNREQPVFFLFLTYKLISHYSAAGNENAK